MTVYAVHDTDGRLVSVGSVLADPLPAGLIAVELSDGQSVLARSGGAWDPESLTFGDPLPQPMDLLEARIADLEAVIDALIGEGP